MPLATALIFSVQSLRCWCNAPRRPTSTGPHHGWGAVRLPLQALSCDTERDGCGVHSGGGWMVCNSQDSDVRALRPHEGSRAAAIDMIQQPNQPKLQT